MRGRRPHDLCELFRPFLDRRPRVAVARKIAQADHVPTTFVASANCGLYCGADVDFVDIDARSWNIDVAALAHKLEAAERAGRLPKVLVPVHLCGQPTEQEAS